MLHSDPSFASVPVSQRGLRQEEVFWFGRCHSSGILPTSITETVGVGRKRLSAVPPASGSSLEGLESNHADRPQLFLSGEMENREQMAQALVLLQCKERNVENFNVISDRS